MWGVVSTKNVKLGVVAHIWNPSTQEVRWKGHKCEVSLDGENKSVRRKRPHHSV
jgi:hypothetical protein